MLHLSRDRLIVSIFPGSGWLRYAGGTEIHRYPLDDAASLNVLEDIELLLDGAPTVKKLGVEVIVSDELSRILHLPWQDKLISDAQREAYARACFEQAGLRMRADWMVQTGYRHYNGGGIAYALPRSVVISTKDYLASRNLRLRSIMPLSARAYWKNNLARRRARSLLLLGEARRMSAFVFDGIKFSGIHVQPGSADELSVHRLVRTVDATFPGVNRVQVWTSLEQRVDKMPIQALVPEASVEYIDNAYWD